MKRTAVILAGIVLLGLPLAQPGQAEVNVNVNVGEPALPAPPAPLVLQAPPEFIFPPELGFYVAVGVPHNIVYIDDTYYLFWNNSWFRGPYFNGPWRFVWPRQLPFELRKHKFERIRFYRDEEYRRFQGGHDQYRGRRFKPDKEWKEERKEGKERRKEEKRYEKEERKMDKGEGKGRHGGHDD